MVPEPLVQQFKKKKNVGALGTRMVASQLWLQYCDHNHKHCV